MKRHVLVVDDNPSDILKVSAILDQEGFVPVVANDAESALAQSKMYRIDLAVIDVQMPGMNGFRLTELLRSHSETRNLPVLIMSASYRTPRDVQIALNAGANDFILKPLDNMIFSAKLTKLLTRKVAWGEWSMSAEKNSEDFSRAYGSLRLGIELISISEMGLRVLSPVALPVKRSTQIFLPLFDELDIPAPFLEVLDCERTKDGYISYLSFIGLPETHLKSIRLYCRKISAQHRNLA